MKVTRKGSVAAASDSGSDSESRKHPRHKAANVRRYYYPTTPSLTAPQEVGAQDKPSIPPAVVREEKERRRMLKESKEASLPLVEYPNGDSFQVTISLSLCFAVYIGAVPRIL